jgi:hypothetical protein
MQITNTSVASASSLSGSSNASSGSNNANSPSFQTLLSELNGYAKADPAQAMENAILAQLGITPAQLQAMTPAQREKVMQEVQDLMKKELKAQQQQAQPATSSSTPPGTSANTAATPLASVHTSTPAHTYNTPKKGTTVDFTL